MKKQLLRKYWYVYVLAGLLLLQTLVLLGFGEDCFVAVHDNLDLFVAHNKMMKNQGIFFAQNAEVLMLGGVSRDTLGSELSVYNMLMFLFPPFVAYMLAYFAKLAVGFGSCLLLAKDLYGDKYQDYKPFLWIVAAGFSVIPVFPAYGMAFTSVPLLVYLLRRIYREPKFWMYACVFAYPLLSYFSYFGFFLLAYMVGAVILLWLRDKKFPAALGISVPVLAIGYVLCEYRLFREMLFGNTVTIRESMVQGDFTLGEVLHSIGDVFVNTIFHAQDSHKYWILPICLVFFLLLNIQYIRKGHWKRMLSDPFNQVMALLLFNCIVYGLYDYKPVRDMFELLLPPLKGFQFNRTIFFNPFLWYGAFFLCLKRLWDYGASEGKIRVAVCAAALAGTMTVMFAPQVYNDFYSNAYHHAYEILKQKESSQVSFREFYSEDLFTAIREEIGYQGQWAAAYGMHPAVLQYNGIATLDGYLGFYSEDYKQSFRRVIAPALEQSEEFRQNFDTWGARAYLFSGAGENTYVPSREITLSDDRLYIDGDAFRELGGEYIFSRIEISNAEELGLNLQGVYTAETSPYTIYVYRNA